MFKVLKDWFVGNTLLWPLDFKWTCPAWPASCCLMALIDFKAVVGADDWVELALFPLEVASSEIIGAWDFSRWCVSDWFSCASEAIWLWRETLFHVSILCFSFKLMSCTSCDFAVFVTSSFALLRSSSPAWSTSSWSFKCCILMLCWTYLWVSSILCRFKLRLTFILLISSVCDSPNVLTVFWVDSICDFSLLNSSRVFSFRRNIDSISLTHFSNFWYPSL